MKVCVAIFATCVVVNLRKHTSPPSRTQNQGRGRLAIPLAQRVFGCTFLFSFRFFVSFVCVRPAGVVFIARLALALRMWRATADESISTFLISDNIVRIWMRFVGDPSTSLLDEINYVRRRTILGCKVTWLRESFGLRTKVSGGGHNNCVEVRWNSTEFNVGEWCGVPCGSAIKPEKQPQKHTGKSQQHQLPRIFERNVRACGDWMCPS